MVRVPLKDETIEVADLDADLRQRLLKRLLFEDETRLAAGQCPTCGKPAAQSEFD